MCPGSEGDMKILVTGASRGIGRGIALVLGRAGHEIGALARSVDGLDSLATELRDAGATIAVAPLDLRRAKDIEPAIDRLTDALGGVDALVNNAGLVIRKSILDLEIDEWRAMMETNVDGPYLVTRAVLPRLRAQGHGHIVNVSSISGRLPLANGSAYAASKFALTGWSESLFLELRDFGIKVSTVYPGSVDTGSHRHDPNADHSWKVTPEEVGEACRAILETSPHNVVSRLEIRPLRKPGSIR